MSKDREARTPTRREQIAGLHASYRRRATRSAALRGAVTGIILGTGTAWSLMIAVGIAHGSWWHRIPAMGYSTAVAIVAAVLIPAVIIIAIIARLN